MSKNLKKNVPVLRFPEFEGKWKKNNLSDICTKISDGIHSTPEYSQYGEFYFINGNNLIDNQIKFTENTKRVDYSEYLKYASDLNTQTILISINGTIGNLAFYNNEKIILGKSACYINLNAKENKIFIFYLLQTSTIRNYFNKQLTGSTIKNLSLTTIKNTKAYFPAFQEQEKIANFLGAIATRLTQLRRKHELLQTYKRGVMQKIFSQQIRFERNDGKSFPNWKKKKLKSITNINPSSDYFPNQFLYIDLERVNNGILSEPELLSKENAPSRAQRVLQKGDILYQTVRPYQRNNLFFNLDGDYVASTGYAQLRAKENQYFLYHLIYSDDFVDRVISRCTGTSYPAINSWDLNKNKEGNRL